MSKAWGVAAVVGTLLGTPSSAWACGDKTLPNGRSDGCAAKGHGLISLDYHYMHGGAHLYSRDVTGRSFTGNYVGAGRRAFVGDTFSHATTLGGAHGLADRLAADASVTFVAARYEGRAPHGALPGWPQMDDGKYHPTFQDASVGLRYRATNGPLTTTPFVRYGFPTRDYVPLGHSAVGRRLKALELGVEVGRSLSPLLPDAYLKAAGSYALVGRPDSDMTEGVGPEQVRRLDLDRRHVMVEGGYALTARLTALAFWDYLHTERGLDFLEVSAANFRMHDAVLGARSHTVGGAVAFKLRDRTSLRAAFSRLVAGQNTHDGSAFAVGVTQAIGRCRAATTR